MQHVTDFIMAPYCALRGLARMWGALMFWRHEILDTVHMTGLRGWGQWHAGFCAGYQGCAAGYGLDGRGGFRAEFPCRGISQMAGRTEELVIAGMRLVRQMPLGIRDWQFS